MGYAEIAEVMGLTVKAVKSLLNRARGNLRAALAGYIFMDSQAVPQLPDDGDDDE
jgi:RNA polymerase sigma-70 factor (ECF subfamily)